MLSQSHSRRSLLLFCLLWTWVTVQRAPALEPDEIALVVNSNVPESTQLAQFYAKQRHIPDNRILVLDLPVADDIPFKQYEETVVPQVREFLKTGQLLGKVKCFVTFYGVPLRIADRVNSPAEGKELNDIRQELISMPKEMQPAVEDIEGFAKKLNPDFKPAVGTSLDGLMARYGRAGVEIDSQLKTITDTRLRAEHLVEFFKVAEPMMGRYASIRRREYDLALHDENKATELPKLQADAADYTRKQETAAPWEQERWDASGRAQLRDLTRDQFGLAAYNRLLNDQAGYLTEAKSGSAFDSELSLVCWTAYLRNGWILNPLNYQTRGKLIYPTFMVSRLDAPTTDLVKSMITTSIEVEKKGLTGRIVLDSLGQKPGDGSTDHPEYGEYDQHFRDLATFLKSRTKLDLYLEETKEIIPAGSQSDVALYCGWHNAGQFVNSCRYVPGAVGYHIASYELVTLRSPGNNGWVKGMEAAGVVSTLGPVAEPYLQAFPRPDEYFPLLLTGKLTATEVYWKTVPWGSWMMASVGDPLYNPFKNHPLLTSLDLPFALRGALHGDAAVPEPVK